jgi:signal transduction histidine kinase
MTDDLIQLAYLDAGKIRLRPQWVDLIEVLEDAITSASAPLREKGLTVHLQLEDDAPPVCADREALEQVIGQLLTNAYLASPPGTEIFISARSRMQQRQVNGGVESAPVLEVKFEDRGGGIAPEDLARVFARRYKAENPLIQGLGDTGVGLAIARALIEAHEGEIWVESEAGSGAAFHFVLPAEAEQVVEP